MLPFAIDASDRRMVRNINILQGYIVQMIRDRRTNGGSDSDLLGILTKDPLFEGDDLGICDEIITFFFAGQKTIAVSTTNLICQLGRKENKQYFDTLMKETQPVVEEALKNGGTIVNDFTYEMAEELEYVRTCFYESMRNEPPVEVSLAQCFSADVTIGELPGFKETTGLGPVTIKGGEMFFIGI